MHDDGELISELKLLIQSHSHLREVVEALGTDIKDLSHRVLGNGRIGLVEGQARHDERLKALEHRVKPTQARGTAAVKQHWAGILAIVTVAAEAARHWVSK